MSLSGLAKEFFFLQISAYQSAATNCKNSIDINPNWNACVDYTEQQASCPQEAFLKGSICTWCTSLEP
jgi:hypothetical protein